MGLRKFRQVCIDDELNVQMTVVGMNGQYLKFVIICKSSEWNELNTNGVVRPNREVASEIL